MNVMAQAHKDCKARIAAGNPNRYADLFRVALRQAHKEYKAMNASKAEEKVFTSVIGNEKVSYTPVIPHELENGDTIMSHGCLFKVFNKKDHGLRPEDCPERQGTLITMDTELLYHPDFDKAPEDEPYYPFPLGWAKTYGVQSNKGFKWCKVVKREPIVK